jgi:hypothetical protein
MTDGWTGRRWADLPGHMIAAFLQLHHSLALVAPLPALLFRLFEELIRLLVLWALPREMPPAVAGATDLGLAAAAPTDLSAVFPVDVFRLDPFSAPLGWTVEPVPSRELCKLLVPGLLEGVVEQSVDMLKRDVVCGATLRRHELRVRD